MSAFTESSRPGRADACPWRPAGLLYLAALLAGLGAGLWAETLWPALANADAAPLPTLQTLALGQLAFVLLVYPMILFKRFAPWHGRLDRDTSAPAGNGRPYWRPVLAESAMFMLLAVPFYVPAAFLADATAADVGRHALCIAAFLPPAWLAGAHFARGKRGAWVVTLALLAAALGMPAAYYIAAEFLTPTLQYWLGGLTPALIVWDSAAARCPSVWPRPLWGWLGWLSVAALAAVIAAIMPPRARNETPSAPPKQND